MTPPRSVRLLLLPAAIASVLAACGGGGDSGPAPVASNQLYTQTNDTANSVVQFKRAADGTLTRGATVASGGVGTNAVALNGNTGPDSLVSQFSVITMSDNGSTRLLAVNGGDGSISVFDVDGATGVPRLLRNNRTAGTRPNSLAVGNGVVYATYLGGSLQLGAYRLASDGAMTQIGLYNVAQMGGLDSTKVAPTQVVVSPDGRFVLVSGGPPSNAVLAFPVNADGSLANPVVNTTNTTTPFAGLFVKASGGGTVYLSTGIAGATLTAYTFSASGLLTAVGQAQAAGVAAPCWLVVTPDGRFAYVGNGSGSISSYTIGANGVPTLLAAVAAQEPGVLPGVNSVAGDSWISKDGRFLYSTYLGDDKVVTYAIAGNGTLSKLDDDVVGTASNLGLQGLAGL